MKKIPILLGLILTIVIGNAQNKSGNISVFGGGGMLVEFNGTAIPVTRQLFGNTPNYLFANGHSNICDSSTGKLLMLCNGYILFDTLGNIIENGDSLVPKKIYTHNTIPNSGITQGSLILPKGSSGLYYVFTPTITDSAYTTYITGGQNKVPFDLLQYHVVDMNANGGMGKVIQKNIELLSNVEMSKVGMMACRHANGYDWWLLKQALDTNMIYTFLVTKDTVVLDTIQGFPNPHFKFTDVVGQSCFSTDGTKYAYVQGNNSKLFIADFDRCYGILSNPKVVNIPIDSTTHPFYILDSTTTGVCFSPNDKYVYLSQAFHIWQFEYNELDSSLAWYKVKQGADTSMQQFANYGQLQRGIDNKIYIGKWGGTGTKNSVIDFPDLKGGACGFCRMCLRYDIPTGYGTNSLANMPDFNLGAIPICAPMGVKEIEKNRSVMIVFPNPTSSKFQIKNAKYQSKKELFNSVGQLIFTTKENELDVSRLSKGVYYIKCEGQSKKVIIE